MESRLETLESSMERMHQSLQTVLKHVEPSASRQASHAAVERQPIDLAEAAAENNEQLGNGIEEATDDPGLWQTPPPEPPPFMAEPTSQPLGIDLPSRATITTLANIFFELVYPWCPLFHKGIFIDELFSPDREVLLHGIIVVGFRFWTTAEPSIATRERCIAKSRERILLEAINTCTLISTQALALLAVDALGQGTGPM
jgi:hypothetical protein